MKIVQQAADGTLIERDKFSAGYPVDGLVCGFCHGDNKVPNRQRGCPKRPKPSREELNSLVSAIRAGRRS